MVLKPVKVVREGLGQQVANAVREAIVRGDYAAGHRLVETELAEALQVSRGPVRDGLRLLEAEGLVAKRGQSVVVLSLTDRDIDELYSLRGALESLALSITMAAGEPADLKGLREIVREMHRAARNVDTVAFALADVEFHSSLCDLSHHRRLASVWRQYQPILTALLKVTVLVDDDLIATTAKHSLLLDLVEAGDSQVALDELADHLDGSHDRMLEAWRRMSLEQQQA